jgi:hypothetical protein
VTLFLPSLVDSRFTLKTFVFSTTVLLCNDAIILAFVTNFSKVDSIFLNEFGVKTCECSGVSCEGEIIAFLSGSESSALMEEKISGFWLAQLCQMYQAQEKLAAESMSQR